MNDEDKELDTPAEVAVEPTPEATTPTVEVSPDPI